MLYKFYSIMNSNIISISYVKNGKVSDKFLW